MNVTTSRPRVDSERESQIFGATIELLVEHGYDKLTFDAVAAAARASKATLYRRWPTKAELVIEALASNLDPDADARIDTGSLRGDLIAMACSPGGVCDKTPALLGSLVAAMHRDEALFDAFQSRFVGPKVDAATAAFERARARGEVGPDADVRTLALAMPAICIHEVFVYRQQATPERVAEILDHVVLPACRATLHDDRNLPDDRTLRDA